MDGRKSMFHDKSRFMKKMELIPYFMGQKRKRSDINRNGR
jgi:hypothetical protein